MAIDFYKFLENEKTKDEHSREKLAAVLNPNNGSNKGYPMAEKQN